MLYIYVLIKKNERKIIHHIFVCFVCLLKINQSIIKIYYNCLQNVKLVGKDIYKALPLVVPVTIAVDVVSDVGGTTTDDNDDKVG